MIMRPVDEQGDVLPVLSSGEALKGAEAVAALVRARLELTAGEWWEDPARGNATIDMLRESRFTEADGQALAAYLTGYIRRTPGVREVREAAFSAEGRQFSFSCAVETGDGTTQVAFRTGNP